MTLKAPQGPAVRHWLRQCPGNDAFEFPQWQSQWRTAFLR